MLKSFFLLSLAFFPSSVCGQSVFHTNARDLKNSITAAEINRSPQPSTIQLSNKNNTISLVSNVSQNTNDKKSSPSLNFSSDIQWTYDGFKEAKDPIIFNEVMKVDALIKNVYKQNLGSHVMTGAEYRIVQEGIQIRIGYLNQKGVYVIRAIDIPWKKQIRLKGFQNSVNLGSTRTTSKHSFSSQASTTSSQVRSKSQQVTMQVMPELPLQPKPAQSVLTQQTLIPKRSTTTNSTVSTSPLIQSPQFMDAFLPKLNYQIDTAWQKADAFARSNYPSQLENAKVIKVEQQIASGVKYRTLYRNSNNFFEIIVNIEPSTTLKLSSLKAYEPSDVIINPSTLTLPTLTLTTPSISTVSPFSSLASIPQSSTVSTFSQLTIPTATAAPSPITLQQLSTIPSAPSNPLPSVFLANESTYSSVSTDHNCAQFSASGVCFICADKYYLRNNQCWPITEFCLTYSSNSKCASCFTGWVLLSTGSCVQAH